MLATRREFLTEIGIGATLMTIAMIVGGEGLIVLAFVVTIVGSFFWRHTRSQRAQRLDRERSGHA